jgi:hypothetical protein
MDGTTSRFLELAGNGKFVRPATITDDSCRRTNRHNPIRQLTAHHSAGADDAVPAHVGHDNGATPYPAAGPNAYHLLLPRLLTNRNRWVIEPVRLCSTWNVNSRCEQRVALNVDQAQLTLGPDVHVLFQSAACFGQEGSALDGYRRVTESERANEKGPAQILSQQTRDQREQLT